MASLSHEKRDTGRRIPAGVESSNPKRFGWPVLWPLQGLDKVWYNRDRHEIVGTESENRIPHARGGGPTESWESKIASDVFPTLVGVDRS
jgi:hypothetical protein